jgi:type III restriction enzyme
MEGRRPLDFIQQTNPIVIIDEPQSVDNTDKAKDAVKSLNPLCILRYSATHRDTYNLMYRLGPVEAYEKGLVKSIEVYAMQTDDGGRHVHLVSTDGRKRSAKIEVQVGKDDGSFQKKVIEVNGGKRRDIEALTNNAAYAGLFVANVETTSGREFIEFDNGDVMLLSASGVASDTVRAQIRATIETHLDREMRFLERGIKILSLFFIDSVANYRLYTEEGPKQGPYAVMFEEEYLKAIRLPKYQQLFSKREHKEYALNEDVKSAHDGYFAMDKGKKGTALAGEMMFIDSKGEGKTAKDDSAYDLIMKDKEKLLSIGTPLRFIFSHSALKEGWDNPNVFQICTLVETSDTMTKRQKVGRGLRLPVDQTGERVRDEQVNVLTVVANESYQSFAETLQKEIESETNTRFGVVDARLLEDILFQPTPTANPEPLGYDRADEIVKHLAAQDMLDRSGKAKETLKEMVVVGKAPIPQAYASIEKEVADAIRDVSKRVSVKDKSNEVRITMNKEVFLSPDFSELWGRIKQKTRYNIHLDKARLVAACASAIKDMRPVTISPVLAQLVKLEMSQAGVQASDPLQTRTFVRDKVKEKRVPDLLAHISTHTGLMRRTIADILVESGTLESVYNDPEKYMAQVVEIINLELRKQLVDGVKYEKIAGEWYEQRQFESDELVGYLKQNALEAARTIHSHVLYDSATERTFAERLEADRDVKLYVKLPRWFTVPTPLGEYSPDWAVVIEENGEEKVYFIVETKGSSSPEDLRFRENAKIKCGKKHFTALGTDVDYSVASSYDNWRQGQLMSD